MRRVLGNVLRGVPWRVALAAGRGFYCGAGAHFRRGEHLTIGRNVFFGLGCHIAAPCEIADDVMLASRVALVGGDHRYDLPGVPMNRSGTEDPAPIRIGPEAWVGHGVIVLAGVQIGAGAIVAAGSVVTKDVPSCTIWAGVPARQIRRRFLSPEEESVHRAFLEARYGAQRDD